MWKTPTALTAVDEFLCCPYRGKNKRAMIELRWAQFLASRPSPST